MGINLSNKLRDSGNGNILHWCSGCNILHSIATKEKNSKGCMWNWNNDINNPTFTPSIIVNSDFPEKICHYFIENGYIKYLSDCKHKLAGQIIPIPNLPDWLLNLNKET